MYTRSVVADYIRQNPDEDLLFVEELRQPRLIHNLYVMIVKIISFWSLHRVDAEPLKIPVPVCKMSQAH